MTPDRSQHHRIEPVTRVGGGLGVRFAVERNGGRPSIDDAFILGSSYRGYETILLGRDPRDVLSIASRVCGWCGSAQQTTASMALETAWGVQPPPLAVVLRAVAEATGAIWVHAAHLAVRAGPDWCAPVVKETSPWLWEAALNAEAPGAATHGFTTIAELMEALTPVTGSYWKETLPAGRRVQEMIALLYGKFPHPSVLSPGGVGTTDSPSNFTAYYTRLYRSVDYVKKVVAIWDDLVDFLIEADPRLAEQGERPANFIQSGAWDDPAGYVGTVDSLTADGALRLSPPGVIVDGQVVTRDLKEVHDGIVESVDHSFFAPATPAHPSARDTAAQPQAVDLDGAYSWSTAPRWNDQVLETGPLGRLWLTATRTDFPTNDFIEPTGTGVKILVPGNFLPETVIEWRIPKRINALERLRADAYGVAFAGLCAAISLLRGFDLSRAQETDLTRPFEVLDGQRRGVGLWESGRGFNGHWIQTDGKRVSNYQIVGPSTWNASPRDGEGRPGPLEQALMGTPVIEEQGPDSRLRGLDALRVIHSFDPCMNCGSH